MMRQKRTIYNTGLVSRSLSFCGAHGRFHVEGVKRFWNANIKINWMSHVAWSNDDSEYNEDVKLNRLKMSIVKFIWAKNRWEIHAHTNTNGNRNTKRVYGRIAHDARERKITRMNWIDSGVFTLKRARTPSLPFMHAHTLTQSSFCACSTVDRPTNQLASQKMSFFSLLVFDLLLYAANQNNLDLSLLPFILIYSTALFMVGVRLSLSSSSLHVSGCMVVAEMRWNYHNLTIGIHGIIFILRPFARLLSSVASTFSQSEALYFHWSPGITKTPNNNNNDWMMQPGYWNGLEPSSNKYTTKWNET